MGDSTPTTPAPPRSPRLGWAEVAVLLLVPAAMLGATALKLWPAGFEPAGYGEVLGFATGGVCVWLVVREHVWNWPVGMLNNVLLFALFYRGSLFADAGLQVVFFALAVLGWWQWSRGGPAGPVLPVRRATHLEWVLVVAAVPLGTLVLWNILVELNGAAPLWDALAAVLSIAAQTLMTRKRLEHWLLWIAVDCISVPLFASRDLKFIAALYAVFLVMCVIGLVRWWREWRARVRA